MTQRERRREARRKWQRLVSEQGRSGQSVAAFCRERQLCPSHFFWWRKRLRAAELGALSTQLRKFVEVKLTRAVPERAGMGAAARAATLARPEADPRPRGDGRVEVVLRNGRRLRVGPGFDAAHVQALAAVLESEA
jgi:hypothetical protein